MPSHASQRRHVCPISGNVCGAQQIKLVTASFLYCEVTLLSLVRTLRGDSEAKYPVPHQTSPTILATTVDCGT